MRVNYRLKCLAWTGQQQEPRVWSQGLPACPCSLQQGQQDPRFKSSRGGKWTCCFPTLLVPKISLPTSPARVAGVHSGWVGRQPQGKWGGGGPALPCRDRENEEEQGLTCPRLVRLVRAGPLPSTGVSPWGTT